MELGVPGTPDGPPILRGRVELKFYERGGPSFHIDPTGDVSREDLTRDAVTFLQWLIDHRFFGRLADDG